jgi:hypothetical protein
VSDPSRDLADRPPADEPTASWSWADAPNLDLLQTAVDQLHPAAAARPIRVRVSLSLLERAVATYNETVCAIAMQCGKAPDPAELLPAPTVVELHRLRAEMRSRHVDAWGREHAAPSRRARLRRTPVRAIAAPRRLRRGGCGRERRPGARRRTQASARGPDSGEPAPADGRGVPEGLAAGRPV